MRVCSQFRLLLTLLAFAVPTLWAQDGLRGAVSKSGNVSSLLQSPFGSSLVAADFDNDQKPDGALLLDAGMIEGQRMFRIELHVSAGANRNLTFRSNDPALAISALDVNQDGIPDLIVEQAFTHKRLQIWLNDGHGKFRQARVEDFPPQTDAPCRWQTPIAPQACTVPGLPSRIETHHALQLLQVLRFDSSSSHWRVRANILHTAELISSSHSPRAPPTFSSL